MNEQSNTHLVQQAYQNIAAGDVDSVLRTLAEDILWQMPEMENVSFAGTRQGRKHVGQFFEEMAKVQDVLEFRPEQFIAQDDKVVVLGHFRMHVKATGKESRSAWAHVWTVKDGTIHGMREYVDSLAVNRAHTP